jgi:hypothetical protein
MLSLAKLVLESGARPDKFGDRFPLPTTLPILPETTDQSDLDRISNAIRSSFVPLVLWGLSSFPLLCEREKRGLSLLPSIVAYFSNPNPLLEFASISCIAKVLRLQARTASSAILPRLLDRLEQYPAREYVEALTQMLPYITQVTFESCINPMILRLLGGDEPGQYAAGELLRAVRFGQIAPGPDLFAKFLTAPVIVNEYLADLVQCAAETGAIAEDWCCRLYPARLMAAGAAGHAIRLGVAKVIVCLIDVMHSSLSRSYVGTALQWAETSTEVALFLLEQADAIAAVDDVTFLPKLHALIGELAASTDPSVLGRLPHIMGVNPNALLNSDLEVEPIIGAIGASVDPDVRLAFLQNYILLFARTPGRSAQTALLTAFLGLFERPSESVIARLTSADTYAFFGPGKLVQVVPAFTELLPKLTAWRDIGRAAETFLSFPSDIIRSFWDPVVHALLPLFMHHCHPLASCCASFLPRLSSTLDRNTRGELTEVIMHTFEGDQGWAVRRLMPGIVAGFARLPEASAQVWVLLPLYEESLADPISAVVAAALLAWPSVKMAAGVREREFAARIAELCESPDARVREAGAGILDLAGGRRSSSMGSIMQSSGLPDLPRTSGSRMMTATTMRLPDGRLLAGGKVVRRINPSGRVVMPSRRVYTLADIRGGRA